MAVADARRRQLVCPLGAVSPRLSPRFFLSRAEGAFDWQMMVERDVVVLTD